MIQILPAIIPHNREQLLEEMHLVSSFARLVQVDISDGVFARPKTWPYNGADNDFFDELRRQDTGWPEWEHTDIELHLMVEHPETVLSDWIDTGIAAVVTHIEATDDFQKVIDMCRARSVSVGIAIKPSTDISRIAPFADKVDFIQCMGSDMIGSHGVSLDQHAVEKIRTLRATYPESIIAIDIGVTEESAQELADAGATKFIVGSVILQAENPKKVFEYLQSVA